MTSRYFGCFQFIDVSTSTKNKFSNSQKRVTSLKCPFSPFFMETFVIFTQNSASPVPDHTQTQRSGAQITLPLSTDQPGSHENSEFRRLSLSVIYGMIEEMYVNMKEGKNQTSKKKIAMMCCISAERFHYTKLQ